MAYPRRRRRRRRIPARVPRLQFLLWDGTDPSDSHALGNQLRGAGCVNLLHDSPRTEEFVSRARRGRPRWFHPAGVRGTDFSTTLYRRGVLEFPRRLFDPTHHNRGRDRPHLLAYSGHGIPGFMFSEGMTPILICASRPLTGTGYASWRYMSQPQWNHPNTKVVLFSACRQLAGKPQQYYWSTAMRGSNPVHMILSYRNTAPAAAASARVNRRFVRNLRGGQPFVQAWKNAHSGATLQRRWAALCYKDSVNDRFDDWSRRRRLPSHPNPATGKILYFDSANLNGREVQRPVQVLDCWMNLHNRTEKIPPWFLFRPNIVVDLHIEFTASSGVQFAPGDELWIGAVQVRPDYAGANESPPHHPFNIQRVFTFEVTPDPVRAGTVRTAGLLHDRTAGYTASHHDVYILPITRGLLGGWLNATASNRHLRIPIRLLDRFNDHLPVYYFMLKVKKPGGTSYGIPTILQGREWIANQTALVDDFQYCVYVMGAAPSP